MPGIYPHSVGYLAAFLASGDAGPLLFSDNSAFMRSLSYFIPLVYMVSLYKQTIISAWY